MLFVICFSFKPCLSLTFGFFRPWILSPYITGSRIIFSAIYFLMQLDILSIPFWSSMNSTGKVEFWILLLLLLFLGSIDFWIKILDLFKKKIKMTVFGGVPHGKLITSGSAKCVSVQKTFSQIYHPKLNNSTDKYLPSAPHLTMTWNLPLLNLPKSLSQCLIFFKSLPRVLILCVFFPKPRPHNYVIFELIKWCLMYSLLISPVLSEMLDFSATTQWRISMKYHKYMKSNTHI